MKRLNLIFVLFILLQCWISARENLFVKPAARRINGRAVPSAPERGIKIKKEVLQELPVSEDGLDDEISFEKLTPGQKLAQSIFIAVDIDTADKYRSEIEQGLVGGVLIQWGDYSLEQTKKLVDKLQSWAQKSPSRIPLLIAIDYEGGTVYTPVTLGFPYLPTNMMIAASRNVENAASLFFTVALELKSIGIHINFAPVIDVNINPANPIIGVRSFGSDTLLVGDMGAALIAGMQNAGIMAVAKHFPGHGETVVDSHLDLPRLVMSKEEFERTHLPPFKQAVDNGVMGVMTAHIIYDFFDETNPATFSPKIIKDLLKERLGFNGIVISDSLDMGGAIKGSNMTQAAIKSLSSGVDIILTSRRNPRITHKRIMEQIGLGIPAENIESSAKKIFELKKRLGLFEKPQYYDKNNNDNKKKSFEAFTYFADKVTREAITVVKAEADIIPYAKQDGLTESESKRPKLCSVFFAHSRFSGQLPDILVPFMEKGWQTDYYNARMRPRADDIARAKKCMQDADLVLLGSMQWADKSVAAQRAAISELLKSDKDIILISLMSPYDIKHYPQAKNIMALYGINKLSSRASADIILGNIEAKGKLPIKL
jgi:beta-N-acetylhexosaminidase